jgi:stringent starvation protein B
MTPSRPYLIRAIYQWIADNGATPHLLVDASTNDVRVPREFVENNKIILNIGPMAVHGLTLGNELVEFSARFSGKSRKVSVPVQAVLAIYARENGEGMVFGSEPGCPDPAATMAPAPGQSKGQRPSGKPSLKVVK